MIKLPSIAKAYECTSGVFNRTIVKIPKKIGWDILQIIADYNAMHVIDLAKICDANVYCDHIILDTSSLSLESLVNIV